MIPLFRRLQERISVWKWFVCSGGFRTSMATWALAWFTVPSSLTAAPFADFSGERIYFLSNILYESQLWELMYSQSYMRVKFESWCTLNIIWESTDITWHMGRKTFHRWISMLFHPLKISCSLLVVWWKPSRFFHHHMCGSESAKLTTQLFFHCEMLNMIKTVFKRLSELSLMYTIVNQKHEGVFFSQISFRCK